MKKVRWVIVVILFLICGAIGAWLVDDNNLLQGATTKSEIATLLAERRTEMAFAFLIFGLSGGLLSLGAFFLFDKFTSPGDET